MSDLRIVWCTSLGGRPTLLQWTYNIPNIAEPTVCTSLFRFSQISTLGLTSWSSYGCSAPLLSPVVPPSIAQIDLSSAWNFITLPIFQNIAGSMHNITVGLVH